MKHLCRALAVLALLACLVDNKATLGRLLAADGSIDSPTIQTGILIGQLLLLLAGLWIFVNARRFGSLNRSEYLLLFSSLTLATLLGAVALELVMRIRHQCSPPGPAIVQLEPEVFEADPWMGYRLRPGGDPEYRYPPPAGTLTPIAANRDGLRNDRELDQHDGRLRILVVGDSFVFGLGVREEDRLTERLEDLRPEWRVDNLSMPGWGLDLMIRGLERFASKADPDIVILGMYTDDFRRLLPYYAGLGLPYPKFELRDSQLSTVPYPHPGPLGRLRLVQALYQLSWERNRNRYDLNEALLDRYLDLAGDFDFRPAVVFFPGRSTTIEDQTRQKFLEGWSVTNGVPYRDLTQPLHEAGIENVFIQGNYHWNASGHLLAAMGLDDLITSMLATPD